LSLLLEIKTKKDEIKAKQIFQKLKNKETIISLKDIEFEDSLEFGLIYAAKKYLKKIGIEEAIKETFREEKKQFDLYNTLLYAGINRLYKPGSDNNFADWLKEAWSEEDIKPHQIYRMLDAVEKHKEEIEKAIYEQLKRNELKTDIVFYDLTSSYFESSDSDFAKFGNTKDYISDRKQIVIGVILCDGLPITHYVFKGNTVDKSTLKQTVEDLKTRFNIEKVIFVADRGIITVNNLKELEQNNYDYIIHFATQNDAPFLLRKNKCLATKRRNELLAKPISTKENISAKEVYKEDNRRYVLCLNKEVRTAELKMIKELKNKLEKFLTENKDKKDLKLKVYRKFGKASKFVDFENIKINEETLKYELQIAGKFLLVTTTEMNKDKVLDEYKELRTIESFFSDLKHFVNIRPIYHQKTRRINGHVFVCVFSLLIKKLLEKKIERNDVEKLKKIKLGVLNTGEERIFIVKKIGEMDRKIFESIGIEAPGKFM
ncbi:MAG: IS1634 family transposase, partial [Candidatus Aenigmarchaeota archaeon]|nr:IS1634 family transposase [Candidatus Aenigmarchaeota archaeon]